jgi:hypothetical protein
MMEVVVTCDEDDVGWIDMVGITALKNIVSATVLTMMKVMSFSTCTLNPKKPKNSLPNPKFCIVNLDIHESLIVDIFLYILLIKKKF